MTTPKKKTSKATALAKTRGMMAPGLEGRYELGAVALKIKPDATFDECQRLFKMFEDFDVSLPWYWGDLLLFTEQRHGEKYAQLVDASRVAKRSPSTLKNWVYVAEHVQISRRREKLDWSLHAEVASLTPPQQERWLDAALKHNMTRKELRASIKEGHIMTEADIDAKKSKKKASRKSLEDAANILQECLEADLGANPLEGLEKMPVEGLKKILQTTSAIRDLLKKAEEVLFQKEHATDEERGA